MQALRVIVDGRQTAPKWDWWDEGIDDILIGMGKDYSPSNPVTTVTLEELGAEIFDLEGIETYGSPTEDQKFITNDDGVNGKTGGEMTVHLYRPDADRNKVEARLQQWAADHDLKITIK